MITDSEALSLYQQLREILIETRFEWVAREVDFDVRLGKTEAKRIRTTERDVPDEFLLPTIPRLGKPATFTGSVEYTPKKRLGLLIDALKHASVEVAEFHDATMHTLNERAARRRREVQIGQISFVDPATGETREASTPETRQKLATAAADLRPLLQELEDEL